MAKGKALRRRYALDFKRQVVEEAGTAGASVAEVARRHGLNANLVFNWRKKFGLDAAPVPARRASRACQLVPVEIWPDIAGQTSDAAIPAQAMAAGDPEDVGHVAAADRAMIGVIEIGLPCGTRLRCSAGTEPALLGQALAALRPGRMDDLT